jgi:two-component system response regulator MprA
VAVERSVPDAVVLDITMPASTVWPCVGDSAPRGLAVPILLLTARDAVADRVAGLDAGGDDYLVKPFASEELTARLRALLRRGRTPSPRLVFADVVLDPTTRMATRGGRELALTPREGALLELLLRNPRAIVSREQALDDVWADGDVGSTTSSTATSPICGASSASRS